jgi:hypothetical protein
MGRYLDKAREVKAQQGQSQPTNSDVLNVLNVISPADSPPLDRPPATETELRRLMDYLGDPAAFAQWFQRLMEQTDPAEGLES